MQAVLLAGGQGTRLHPLTRALPKPMVPVMNRPWLDRLVEWLAGHGVERMVFTLCHQPQVISEYFTPDRLHGAEATFVVESEPLGTGGAIRNAARDADETVVVINADIVTHLDLAHLVKKHCEEKAQVSITLARTVDASSYGAVELDRFGRVQRFVEKPPAGRSDYTWINAGVYVWEPGAIARIPEGRAVSVEREVFPGLIADGLPVYGYKLGSYWTDLGTRERYLNLHWDIMAGRTGISVPGVLLPDAETGPVWLEGGVDIAATATVIGPVLLGAGTRIRPGAVVGPRVVTGRDVEIGAGSRVVGSVLWQGALVGSGVVVEQSVIGSGVVLTNDRQCSGVLVA